MDCPTKHPTAGTAARPETGVDPNPKLRRRSTRSQTPAPTGKSGESSRTVVDARWNRPVGPNRRSRGVMWALIEAARMLRAKGLSYRQIADIFATEIRVQVSGQAIAKALGDDHV